MFISNIFKFHIYTSLSFLINKLFLKSTYPNSFVNYAE